MNEDTTYSARIKLARDALKSLSSIYADAVDQIKIQEAATQDILHQMELGSYEQGRKYYGRLRKVRKRRREYKDTTEILESFNTLISSEYGIKFMRQLDEVLGSTRKKEITMKNRHYNPKYFKSLPISED